MKFTTFKDNNSAINNALIFHLFGCNSCYANDNILNHKDISISGSSILQLYNQYILKNADNININDIDIYYQISINGSKKLNDLIFQLVASGYTYKHFTNKSTIFLMIMNQINSAHRTPGLAHESSKYFSLFKFINRIITLKNPITSKSVDIILIKCNIKKLLLESFDFDIVKNYYSKGVLYILKSDAILNKKANMSLSHFKNRVLDNIYELYNFINRYTKYNNRGYDIHIDNIYIPKCFIKRLQNILYYIYEIDICNFTKKYTNNCFYKNNYLSNLLMNYYYNTFYINDEYIKIIYHPQNIWMLLGDY